MADRVEFIESRSKAAGIILVRGFRILMGLNKRGTYELFGGRKDVTNKYDIHSSLTGIRENFEECPMHYELPALQLILANPRYIQLTKDGQWVYMQYFMRVDTLDDEFVERLNENKRISYDPRPCYNEIVSYKLVDYRRLHEVSIRDRDLTILANVKHYLRVVSHFTPSVESINGYFGIIITIPKTDTSRRKQPARKKVLTTPLRKRESGQ